MQVTRARLRVGRAFLPVHLRRPLVLAAVALAWSGSGLAGVYVGAWTPLYRGVDYAVGFATADDPCVQKVHALRVDTTAPGIRFTGTPRCDGWVANERETRRQTTREFVAASGAQAAINGDFYALPGSTSDPTLTDLEGLAISEGQVVSPAARTDSLLVGRHSGARIAVTRARTDLRDVWTAVSGRGRVLADGVVQETWPARHPRTGVGISRDGRYVYLVTVDGRQPGVSEGATTGELGQWLLRLGAYQGLNLDGGGSTTMALSDGRGGAVVLNVPVGDSKTPWTERRNGSHLGVSARPLRTHRAGTPQSPGETTPMDQPPRLSVEQRTVEPLLVADRPHEDFCLGYCSVIREGDRWRMWYEAYDHTYRNDADGYLCYAESRDGVHWEKPDLSLAEVNGSRANNVLISGRETGGVHGHTVLLDASAPPAERLKIVFTKWVAGQWQVFGGTSADGFYWRLSDHPLLAANSDTQTVCFRDGGCYRLYVRMWSRGDFAGKRIVGHTESPTFDAFPAPEVILRPHHWDPPDLHFYSSAAGKLRNGLYVMFPSAFYTGEDVVRAHAAWGTDGRTFHRLGREPLLDVGSGFDSMGLYVAPGAIPADDPNTYWCYYVGTDVGHDRNVPATAHYAGGIGRFLLRVE